MKVPISKAKNSFSKLISAVHDGEQVVITRHGKPIVELTRYVGDHQRGGIDFSKLEETRRRLGIEDEDGWLEEWDDPKFSLHVLGMDDARS